MSIESVIVDLKSADFEDLIKKHDLVCVDFWASFCAPCKEFSNIYQEAAARYPLICFAKVNIEQESELSNLFHIQSIPHLMVFKQGIAIYSESGSMPLSVLLDLVEQAIAADVTDLLHED